jgi:hypothetical protein
MKPVDRTFADNPMDDANTAALDAAVNKNSRRDDNLGCDI